MSVFQNLYTSNYEKIEKENRIAQYYEGFNFFDNCMTTVLRTFKWGNLPNKLMPSFYPEFMFQYGGSVGFTRENGEPVLYAAYPQGKLLDSATFDTYLFVTPSGRTFQRKADECVIGYNNCFRMPYVYKIDQMSQKMARAIMAVDASLDRAIFPVILNTTDESQLSAFEEYNGTPNFYKKLKTYLIALKGKFKDGDVEPVNLFDNSKNDILALWDVYVRYRNLFASMFGINNVEVQKRERLTQAEGSGNDEYVRYTLLWDMFDNRRTFVDEVKEKFDYELEFELNRDIQTVYQLTVDNDQKIADALIEITKGSNIGGQERSNDDTDAAGGETNENQGD